MRCEAECLNTSDVPEGPHAVAAEPCAGGSMDLTAIGDGDGVRYANADFGATDARGFEARVASALHLGPSGRSKRDDSAFEKHAPILPPSFRLLFESPSLFSVNRYGRAVCIRRARRALP